MVGFGICFGIWNAFHEEPFAISGSELDFGTSTRIPGHPDISQYLKPWSTVAQKIQLRNVQVKEYLQSEEFRLKLPGKRHIT